ncbi:hypothetical protein GIX45_28315 [Erwinia sp. CPCC 100877]|nr:hypothetical protein [Erwinia sp. CPCC 100877]
MELEINGGIYKFVFGFGFVKEMNKRYSVEGNGLKMNAGLDTIIVNLLTSDTETLIETLKVANITEKPRISEKDLIEYVGKDADVDQLFDWVIDGLKESGFTKRKTSKLIEQIEEKTN